MYNGNKALGRFFAGKKGESMRIHTDRQTMLGMVVLAWGLALLFGCAGWTNPTSAADLELVDAFGNVSGFVDVNARGLSVYETNGDRWFYRRAPRYDRSGGSYLGFFNLELNRAIRFPRSGVGPIERADFDAAIPRFVRASVTAQPVGTGAVFTPYLHQWLAPVYGLGPTYAYGYGPVFAPPVAVVPGWSTGVTFAFPTTAAMTPLSPLASSPLSTRPRSMLIDTRVVPGKPLKPATLAMRNRHRETLRVQVSDLLEPTKTQRFDIRAGQAHNVTLQRDPSSTRVQVYQTWDAAGAPIEQEVTTTVPAPVRYQVLVHEMRWQSIAIDRTGTSPHPIEDVNMQGRGLGQFPLPPGDELQSGVLDVYERALAAGNAGLIAPELPR
ncbi:MAG: hypothetical protein AAGD07_20360 [Planctomycetota bacterium]